MFISRVEIPWNISLNPYNFHRQLWRLFPEQARETRRSMNENRRGFLFRVEKFVTGSPISLLLQSRQNPYPAPGVILTGCRKFEPRPALNQRLAFILTANVTKKIRDLKFDTKPGKRSDKCRVPLIKEDEQMAWLSRKLEGAASLEQTSTIPQAPLYFRKGTRPGKLSTVTFEGTLRVTFPENLTALLVNGIGPAKAFGCGLMLVRRV